MKSNRKLISLLCLFVFIISFVALTTQGVSALDSEDFEYQINDEGYAEITRYIGRGKSEVIIPSDIDGYEVKKISSFNVTNVKRIIVSEGIETIGTGAFAASTINEIVFPASLRTIESTAFYNISTLYSCTFEEGLEIIEENAFSYCPIQDLNLPVSILEIHDFAFDGHQTKELTIPQNIEVIGFCALRSESLEKIIYNAKNLYDVDESSFGDSVRTVIVEPGVTDIPAYLFKGCPITSLTLPMDLETIGECAFDYVKTLKKVIIPESVRFIGTSAFWDSTTIYGKKDSVAHKFAIDNGNSFVNNDVTKMTYKYKTENVYTGNEIYPAVTVTNLGYTPVLDTDYTIVFSNNVNIGKGKITITGKGDFVGTKELFFVIGYDLSKAKITVSDSSFAYNPAGVVPPFTAKYDENPLKEAVDFTVTYKNNKKIGTATIVLQGKGDYVGTVEKDFTITPTNVSGLKVSSRTTNSLTFKWKKVSGATGYIVYSFNPKTERTKRIATTSKTKYTVKKCKAGTEYIYAVKAYTKVKGENILSPEYTMITTATSPDSPSLNVVVKKGNAVIKWSKEKCTGYEVYMKSGKGKYKKILTVKGSSKTSGKKTKLKKGKTYCFKVRAYKTVDGEKIYSSFSAEQNVKIK